jgi:hypothetical protein
MQTARDTSINQTYIPDRPHPVARPIAIALTLIALACGTWGLLSLSQETWGVGLIAFGCLLGIVGLLAQGAEHFARAAAADQPGNWSKRS